MPRRRWHASSQGGHPAGLSSSASLRRPDDKRSAPEVIENYLEAENRYSLGMMEHTRPLQQKLFAEKQAFRYAFILDQIQPAHP